MTASPILALRAAIRAKVAADAELAGLMGGAAKLFDEPPRGEPPLYAVFGDVSATDWSDTGGRGHEQDLRLVVWSRPGSAASGLKAAERLAALLDDAPLALAGHHLVHLAVTAIESARDTETTLARVTVRLRAVTQTGG